MKATPYRPRHASYMRHRRQVAWQIIVPVVFAGLLLIGLSVLVWSATFRGNGDVSRWAAISTIWLVIPVMFAGLLVLVALVGFAYLLGRIAGFIPPYSYQAQLFALRMEQGAERIQTIGHKPWLVVPEIGGLMKKVLKKGMRIIRGRLTGEK